MTERPAPLPAADARMNPVPQYGPGSYAVAAITLIFFIGFMSWIFTNRAPKATLPVTPAEIVSNSPWDGSVHQVVSWLQANLKDPKSLDVIEWSRIIKPDSGGFMVRCKYRAKNSFGGYIVEEKLFFLDATGKVTAAVNT